MSAFSFYYFFSLEIFAFIFLIPFIESHIVTYSYNPHMLSLVSYMKKT